MLLSQTVLWKTGGKRPNLGAERALGPVIFGFNTDIKHESTVYHVQSEARQGERLLQTQIFVRGRCIGKKAASYSELVSRPEFSEVTMHEMLKYQHRATIDDLRNGRIDDAVSKVTPLSVLLAEMTGTSSMEQPTVAAVTASSIARAQSAAPSAAAPEIGLHLEFLNPDAVVADHQLVLRFRVLHHGMPVPGAKIIARLSRVGDDGQEHDPVYAQSLADADGQGATTLAASIEDLDHGIVLVQATHEAKSAMKKFRLKSPK